MDFITLPELFLSLGAVVAVFVAIAGLMVLVATELTEEGFWFLPGCVLPLGILTASVFVGGVLQPVLQGLAVVIALGVPGWLAWKRPADCLRTVITGIGLLTGGGAALAGLLSIHFAHFAR